MRRKWAKRVCGCVLRTCASRRGLNPRPPPHFPQVPTRDFLISSHSSHPWTQVCKNVDGICCMFTVAASDATVAAIVAAATVAATVAAISVIVVAVAASIGVTSSCPACS